MSGNLISLIIAQDSLQPIVAAEGLPAAAGHQFTKGQLVGINSAGFLVPFLPSNSAGIVFTEGLLVSDSVNTTNLPANIGGGAASDGDYVLSVRAGTFDLGLLATGTPSGATTPVEADIEFPMYSIDGLNVSSSTFTDAIFVGFARYLNPQTGTISVEIRGVLSSQFSLAAVGAGSIGTTQLANTAVTAAKLNTVTDGVTTDQSGAGSTIEVKPASLSYAQLKVAAVGGFGVPFEATVVLTDSAGGHTTNVAIPGKMEITGIEVVKDAVGGDGTNDQVQVKNHTGPTQITESMVLSTTAHGTQVPATLQNTLLLGTDSIDLIQPAHTTNNGCTVIIRGISRA